MPIRDLPPEKPKEVYDIDVPRRWTAQRVVWMAVAIAAIIGIVLFMFI